MHCTSCGAKLEDGAKFCTNCGAPVANSETNQPTMPLDGSVSSKEATPLSSNENQPTAPIADVADQLTTPIADVTSQQTTPIADDTNQPTAPIASNAGQPTTPLQKQSNQVPQNGTIPLQQQTTPVQQSAPTQPHQPAQQSAPIQQQPTPKQPLSRNAKIGIGVGAGVVVLAIIVGIVFFAMNGANQQQSEEPTTQETQTTVIDNTEPSTPSQEEQSSEPESASNTSNSANTPQAQSDSYTASGISGYTLYTNARFGYSVAYPETFTIQEVNNGSGINLESDTANGTIMINLWGSNNIDGSTAKSALNKMKSDIGIEGYSASGDDWFVYSYEVDGTVVYVKEYVGSGSIAAMSITYPKSASAMGDEMCEIMEPTLEPGDITQAH